MVDYYIIKCPKCSKASAMKVGARKHICPYCGTLIDIKDAIIIKKVSSGREARKIIQELNTPESIRRKLSDESRALS